MTDLVRLKKDDGSWDNLVSEWKAQCQSFDEDYSQFAMASLPVLAECAESADISEGVFALREESKTRVICRANSVHVPGYVGKVLRIRHILMSPEFDFGDASIDDYATVLSKLFVGTVKISLDVLPSPHIKFHLPSIADRQFFSVVENSIGETETGRMFKSFKVRGSWLYISKA